MTEITKKEAISAVGAMDMQIDMLRESGVKDDYVMNAIKVLESAKRKIEKIHKEHE